MKLNLLLLATATSLAINSVHAAVLYIDVTGAVRQLSDYGEPVLGNLGIEVGDPITARFAIDWNFATTLQPDPLHSSRSLYSHPDYGQTTFSWVSATFTIDGHLFHALADSEVTQAESVSIQDELAHVNVYKRSVLTDSTHTSSTTAWLQNSTNGGSLSSESLTELLSLDDWLGDWTYGTNFAFLADRRNVLTGAYDYQFLVYGSISDINVTFEDNNGNPPPAAVPEPLSLWLMLAGTAGLGLARWQRHQ